MIIKVRLSKNAYLTNCTITNTIKRIRNSKYEGNYDLVEVKCENWKDIRQVFFTGVILIPEEFEDDEIVMWKHERIDNSKNDVTLDIQEIRNTLISKREKIATHEVEEILNDIREIFENRVYKLENRTSRCTL